MQLVMNSRQIELTNHLQEYITEKVSKLEKHTPNLDHVRAEVAVYQTHTAAERYTCQMTTWFDRHLLRVEVAAGDIKPAVNRAVTKLDRQLRKLKVQHQHKGRPSIAMNVENLTVQNTEWQAQQLGSAA
ncbi:MAG: ribosome-associated translation inhibitor RaiA [Caldilineaceae bacterium]